MTTHDNPTNPATRPFAAALPIGAVTLGGWLGQRYELTWRGNLLALNWDDDFLRPFQEKKSEAGFYVGMGKTFEGLTRFAAHTQDQQLLALRRHVLDTLLPSQDPDGYLGTYLPEVRISRLWDVHELAYILFALVSDWRLFGEAASLNAAKRLGNHLLERLGGIPLPTEYNPGTESDLAFELTMLGLDRAFLALHRATGDVRYLEFCLHRLDLETWNLPIVEGRHGRLEGHAYAYLCRCLAQIDLRETLGNDGLLAQTHGVVDYLSARGGLLVNGAFSMSECWHSDQNGAGELGETCATAYWIRLCARLLCIEGSGRYGDLIERAIYNALFAAQSPDGRRLRYYVPFAGPRVYWDRDTYCCPGNFRRILAELPEIVCFTTDSGFFVNLYTPCKARILLASGSAIELIQETDYPNSGSVALRLTMTKPERFTVSLRILAWCVDYALSVGGQSIEVPVKDGFVHIKREWQGGESIGLEMKMAWRLVRGQSLQDGRAALLRGPVLFCVNPKRNEIAFTDLPAFELDLPESRMPDEDSTLRPGGMSCSYRRGQSKGPLVFTEFADPDGEAIYFPPATGTSPTGDELLTSFGSIREASLLYWWKL